MSSNSRKRMSRRGFSLIEVLLATAILLGAITVLGELVRMGLRSAAGTRDLAVAQRLCATKLAEVVAGVEPLVTNRETPLLEEPNWNWSLETRPLDRPGLASVKVTVSQNLPPEEHPVTATLVRWIYRNQPGFGASSFDAQPGMPPNSGGTSTPMERMP